MALTDRMPNNRAIMAIENAVFPEEFDDGVHAIKFVRCALQHGRTGRDLRFISGNKYKSFARIPYFLLRKWIQRDGRLQR